MTLPVPYYNYDFAHFSPFVVSMMGEVINIHDHILGISHKTIYNTSNYKITLLFQELRVRELGDL